MRLFAYYAFHTVINSIKKLFKTWVAFFIIIIAVCSLMGMLIGRIVPLIEKSIRGESVYEETVEEIDENEVAKSNLSVFLSSRNLTVYDLVDLCVTGGFLIFVTLLLATVNKGGEIFKPADVPLLFASPMKPQSVLMFRLMNSLGMNIILAFYMLFQIPNLVRGLKISVWSAFVIFFAYMLAILFSTILQIAFYTFSRNTKKGTISVGGILIAFYAVLGGAFILYTTITKQEVFTAAFHFFGNKKTFWIPFVGWIRGMIYCSIMGDNVKSLIYFLLFAISTVALFILIWNVKADFYEDAMFATERVAAKMENSQKALKGGTVTREKERGGNIERDGFHFGSGASVFFYKSVYNRFRFAKLYIFSKTFVIALLAALGCCWLSFKVTNPFISPFLFPAIAITMIVFYRSLGNPLEEDTSREFFILIPDAPIKKIWASIFGTLAVCAIDVVIPLIVAAIITETSPLTVIAWMIFILSVSLFGTTVGAFVSISIPGDHAQNVKLMVQILFVYFGALPSVAFIIVGIILKNMEIMLILGAVFDSVLGLFFSLITPRFLTNK